MNLYQSKVVYQVYDGPDAGQVPKGPEEDPSDGYRENGRSAGQRKKQDAVPHKHERSTPHQHSRLMVQR